MRTLQQRVAAAIICVWTAVGIASSGLAFPSGSMMLVGSSRQGPPPAPTITGILLSNNTFTCGSAGSVGAVTVQGVNNAAATLSLTGADAAQFSLSSPTVPSNLAIGTAPAGCPRTYSVNIVATLSGATGSPFTQAETITGSPAAVAAEVPGPSASLLASPPYTCSTNRYASVAGAGAQNGLDPADAWTLATALTQTNTNAVAGWCVNFAAGTYNISSPMAITRGGNAATPGGYVVWRGSTITNKVPDTLFLATANISTMLSVPAAFVWFDGLDINGGGNHQTGARVASVDCIDNAPTGRVQVNFHHMWLTNSTIEECGQAGVQFNNTEYLYFLHNTFGPSAYNPGFVEASNISIYQPFALCTSSSTPYPNCTSISGEITYATRTTCNSGTDPTGCTGNTKYAYDNYWCSTGTYSYCYNIVFAYDVSWGSYNPSNGSDGEGLIFDDWPGGQAFNGACPVPGGNCTYPNNGLVMGNVFYFNGSSGQYTFTGGTNGGHVVVVNNTSYDNNVDTTTSATFRGGIANYEWTPAVMINNVSKTITTDGGATNNNTAYLACCNTSNPNVWQTNVGAPPSAAMALNSGTVDTWPLTGPNANVDGDPLFVNATPGTFSSHTPGNSNFALCTGVNTPVSGCAGPSPAIGLGQVFGTGGGMSSVGWQQTTLGSIDAGACVSGLSTCP